MGNNPSSTAKSGTAASSPSAEGHESPRHSRSHSQSQQQRKDAARTVIPPHTTHRAVVPPEASLAQAQGSTTVASRPKSLPSTAVSSLSGSPHSNLSGSAKASDQPPPPPSRPVAAPRDVPSKPVDVPTESSSLRSHHDAPHHHHHDASSHLAHAHGPDAHLVSNSSLTDMYLTRPPRLPLPIEEEVHTPGSPILAPDESLPDVDAGGESADGMNRKGSSLSATTVDEEDAEELRVDKTRPVVPTRLEWKRGGDKVYVTGTIFQWNRKHRLHPVEGKPGYFSAIVYILPGTHHVRFLVDGIMQTSPDLPTTVDFGNNLVNYIEVSPDDVPVQRQSPPTARTGVEHKAAGQPAAAAAAAKEQPKPPKGKAVLPKESYRSEIPQYLLDYDQPEESPAYQNAQAAIDKLPRPPSLPGFLAKPILNAAVLMKDDNSVLNMPNHTVLNHLATSSIKNNILAVSATTRYRNKYVTTIMYKPTSTTEG